MFAWRAVMFPLIQVGMSVFINPDKLALGRPMIEICSVLLSWTQLQFS